MPKKAKHVERHFSGSETIRDIVIGMSDGLTVPFALAAGLSGTPVAASIVVMAGLAEIAAGAISMGLGGFLAARSDADYYSSEERREWDEVRTKPGEEAAEIFQVLGKYGLTHQEVAPLMHGLKRNPQAWVDFMMRFELGLEPPVKGRERTSALTIAGSYIVGGLVPLSPYFFVAHPRSGLPISIGVTSVALAIFGFVKGRFTGVHPIRSAAQMVLVGGLAAMTAFGLARLFTPG